MDIPTKKLKCGFAMPVYGLGTWQMGGRFERDPQNDDVADVRAIREAIKIGITHIDTAESYAEGHTEELICEALRGYDRPKLFLVSKVSSKHLRYDDLIASARASLKRLGTSYLDLYLIHAPSSEVPSKETMRAMDYLVSEGLTKNIGVSNFTVGQFKEAQSCSSNRIVANQVHYNLIFREPERKGLVDFCQKNDVMLIAWRPVQKGLLTSRDTPILNELAQKYGKTPVQIAINWLISQENVVTLSKTRDSNHLQENLGALGWGMSKEDIERLRCGFPGQQDVSDAVPLGASLPLSQRK